MIIPVRCFTCGKVLKNESSDFEGSWQHVGRLRGHAQRKNEF